MSWLAILVLAFSLIFQACFAATAAHAQTSPASPNPATAAGPGAPGSPQQSEFTDRDASALLNQITDAFTARNARKVLAAFDIATMAEGELFRQQIIAFFAQTDTVRIHFNLVQTSTEAGKGTAEVEVEMEAAPRDDSATPVHKRDRLRFAAASTSAGWKFTEVQPRAFFSLQPASAEK